MVSANYGLKPESTMYVIPCVNVGASERHASVAWDYMRKLFEIDAKNCHASSTSDNHLVLMVGSYDEYASPASVGRADTGDCTDYVK